MKKLALFLAPAILIFGFVQPAWAHATPTTYEPMAGAVLQKTPALVKISFSERIEEKASGISIYGPTGTRAELGLAKLQDATGRVYGISLKDAGPGTYTVGWQVVSADDGHFTKGAFAFSVGQPTAGASAPASQIQIQHITTVPQAVTISLELVGQAILVGVLVFLLFLWTYFKDNPRVKKIFVILFVVGVVLILVGTLSFLVLKTFDLQQLRSGDFATTLKTFLSTVDGEHALGRAVLSLLAFGIFWGKRKAIFTKNKISKSEILLAGLVLLMIWSRTRVSHAAASHFYPGFSILINALHLLFKEVWAGGLIVLSLGIGKQENLRSTLLSFSKLISVAFGVAGVTGAYVVWMHLKDPVYLFSTQWGACLIVLSIIGGLSLAIRLYHQLIVEKYWSARLVRWLSFTLSLEMLVGVVLLFMTGYIIITTPPYATEKFTFQRAIVNQGAQIALTVHPFEASKFLVTLQDSQKQTELPVSNLVVTLTNDEKNIGPLVVATEQRFVGGYVFPRDLLTPPGQWRVEIAAQRPANYDAVASFKVDYPKDVQISRLDPDKRAFGGFEITLVVVSILILILALYLYQFSRQREVESRESSVNGQTRFFRALSFLEIIIICLGVWYFYGTFFKSDFQKLCQQNGHFWLQSVPMKDGVALSPDTVTGCFLDVGLYHFADRREYQFFFQKRQIVPEVTFAPAVPVAGTPTDLTIALSEVKDGKRAGPAPEIGTYHDRILHVLIVGEDLKTFAHIHTEDLGPVTPTMRKDARFPLRYTFPKAGRYALNLDYIVSGIEYTNVVIVRVQGAVKMTAPVESQELRANGQNKPQTKTFDGYQVTFKAPEVIKAGEKVRLSYYIQKNGQPVTTLEPYLGAAMHLGTIRNDLGRFFHTHGEASGPGSVWFQQLLGKSFKYHVHFAPDQFGPRIITPYWSTKFTTSGQYTIFGEFKDQGKIIVTDFPVNVQ